MKKTLIALAAVAATGTAFADSANVTLSGIIDAAYTSVSGKDAADKGTSKSGIADSGNQSSQIRFFGVDDIGDGVKGGFWLEGALTVDDGNSDSTGGLKGTTTHGFDFARRATVSVMNNFGELRLGRDYSPTFRNFAEFDPFGNNGVATNYGNTVGAIAARYNNTLAYAYTGGNQGYSGNGLYGLGQIAFGEQNDNTEPAGTTSVFKQYYGVRLGYLDGPLHVSFAYGDQSDYNKDIKDITAWNLAASYDFGVAKPRLIYATLSQDKATWGYVLAGVTVPAGNGFVRASYQNGSWNKDGGEGATDKLGVGYVYNLSKRTQLYADYANASSDKKKGGASATGGFIAVGGTNLSGIVGSDGASSGYQLGVTVTF